MKTKFHGVSSKYDAPIRRGELAAMLRELESQYHDDYYHSADHLVCLIALGKRDLCRDLAELLCPEEKPDGD